MSLIITPYGAMKKVARMAGVSIPTVRRALAGHGRTLEKARLRTEYIRRLALENGGREFTECNSNNNDKQ
ncbi:MAG: helix-turn-helix domain-containing protein [Bacteroidales bacterium]|nr:helix-turn-helix domain-containing protein [Bacteroidales bacterium]